MNPRCPTSASPSAGVKAVSKEVLEQNPLPSFGAWRGTVLELWRQATHREGLQSAAHVVDQGTAVSPTPSPRA